MRAQVIAHTVGLGAEGWQWDQYFYRKEQHQPEKHVRGGETDEESADEAVVTLLLKAHAISWCIFPV